MKRVTALSALLLLLAGSAVAGEEYDRCTNEEKALQAEVADSCSGLRYLLNPSGCFAAQKKLDAYTGKCTATGEEKIVIPPPPAVPVKKAPVDAGKPRPEPQPAASPQENDMERLKAENARLRAEITRLKEELDQLKSCPAP